MSDSLEVASNQYEAKKSWNKVFDKIVYFSEFEPLLADDHTSFVQVEDFPHICLLTRAASFEDDVVCIINADIVVAPQLRVAIDEVYRKGGEACTSRRYEFTEQDPNGELVDWGIDFFAALPYLWRKVSDNVPKHYRIGHNCWDSWLLGYFNATVGKWFYDITRQHCIFHPKHQERKRVYSIEPVRDKYDARAGFPFLKL